MQQKYYYRDGAVIYHNAAVHHGGGILNYYDVTEKITYMLQQYAGIDFSEYYQHKK